MPQHSHPWRIGLPLDQWPPDDRQTLEQALVPCGLFDQGGQAQHLRPATFRGYRAAWARYLRLLMATDDLDRQAQMSSRLTARRLEVYLAFLGHLGLTFRTLHGEASALHNLIYTLSPRSDLVWLKRVLCRLRGRAGTITPPATKIVRIDHLVAAAMATMEAVDQANAMVRPVTGGVPRDLASSLDYRDALMVALLSVTLLRRKNFTDLALGSTIIPSDGGYQVVIEGDEVKNGKPIAFEVYPRLNPFIDRYLGYHRPRLLQGKLSDRLWVNAYGEPLRPNRVNQMVKRFTRQHLGVAVSPHGFRACAASSVAELAPELVRIIQSLLVHRTPRTSEKHYIKTQMIRASRRHGEGLEALRRQSRRLAFT